MIEAIGQKEGYNFNKKNMGQLISFILFACIAIGAVIGSLNKTAKEDILDISTTKERISYRKQLYKKRIGIIIKVAYFPLACLVFAWGTLMIHSYLEKRLLSELSMWIGGFFMILLLIIIIAIPVGLFVYIQYKGNLSYSDNESFIQTNKSFVLYLRGFDNDNYSDRFRLSFSKSNSFSEYRFTKAISKYYVCAAIGMTKELDAPLGAKRIYVDDTTWQNDVQDLIDKADYVFVLINNRPSCIWEIETSARYIDKTVYIIDNPVKYVLVQEAVKNVISFPHIPALSMENKFFYLLHVNGEFMSFEYTNTKKGYRKLLENVFERRKSLCRTTC